MYAKQASYISVLILFAYYVLVLPKDGPGTDRNIQRLHAGNIILLSKVLCLTLFFAI